MVAAAPKTDITAEHAKIIWRMLGRYRIPDHDRRDVAQKVLLALWSHLDRYDPSLPFGPWAGEFCRRAAQTYWERTRLRSQRETPIPNSDNFASPAPDPERVATTRDRLRIVEGMLAELPKTHAETVLLHDGCEVPAETIAKEQHVAVNTVRTWVQRGRLDLQAARRRFEARNRHRGGAWTVLPPVVLGGGSAERAALRSGADASPREPAAGHDGAPRARRVVQWGGRLVRAVLGQVPAFLAGVAAIVALSRPHPTPSQSANPAMTVERLAATAEAALPPTPSAVRTPGTTEAAPSSMVGPPKATPVQAAPLTFGADRVRAQVNGASAKLATDDALGALRILDDLDQRDRRGLFAQERNSLRARVLDHLQRGSHGPLKSSHAR